MSFRLTLTAWVIVMIGLLAALLIFVQIRTLDLVTEEAADSTMEAASRNTVSSLQYQVEMLSRMSRALSFSPSIMESSDPSDTSGAAGLIKGNLAQWPALDSIYVGYDNGHWLQVQRLDGLSGVQRERVGGPPDAAYGFTTTQWIDGEELPTRRVFEDKAGVRVGQISIPARGYDARERSWYLDARKAGQLVTSAPYLSFNLGVPMITFSVPVNGRSRGVVGLDLKLDSYSKSASIMKFGHGGYLLIFDNQGSLIAHPNYGALFERSSADTAGAHRLPGTRDLQDTLEGKVIADWDKTSPYWRKFTWKDGREYFARLETIALGPSLAANVLLIAPADEFAVGIRELNRKARVLALLACLLFIPAAWFFGTRMSKTIGDITSEAERLQTMASPGSVIGSFIRELNTLGLTIHKSQRAIWSFSRLAPRAIVRGVLDNSISTELGGARQEITAFFTDVRGFTTIAESADPDQLMQQASRYFTAVTDVILRQGGTVDKFIGDAVMAFWNAPHPQTDHCERACRAALQAKAANEAINREFEAEGLPPFFTRFGLHVGEAVVGNLGSSERMNYTALGNVVNLAARLEGLNKQYDTQILISESVHDRVKDRFRCRFVDTVVAKGMVAETRVYELLGEDDGPG